ncbi:MAG: translation initiation factor IF-2 N-terminal domain-containing protein, partial [Acidobacteria bacterium]|nr:translation initiation factor IF-2 N-terminal domain-containing protein [Acidobacteriota bacterium]
MATVRIYKVAELLGLSSQEITALLKKESGIDVKSASSTIEEVVARQFVERQARQRKISLPGGDMFAETPAAKGRKGAPAKKAPEPSKPAAPALPPPRLVKTHKPVAAPVAEPEPIAGPEGITATRVAEALAPEPQAPGADSRHADVAASGAGGGASAVASHAASSVDAPIAAPVAAEPPTATA